MCFFDFIVTFEAGCRTRQGAVAQLGERFVRNEEVGSSILLSSTKLYELWFIGKGHAEFQAPPSTKVPGDGVALPLERMNRTMESLEFLFEFFTVI